MKLQVKAEAVENPECDYDISAQAGHDRLESVSEGGHAGDNQSVQGEDGQIDPVEGQGAQRPSDLERFSLVEMQESRRGKKDRRNRSTEGQRNKREKYIYIYSDKLWLH